MQAIIRAGLNKRALLSLVLLLALGFYFWTQSRYPQIHEKDVMGGAIALQDSLSFQAKYPLDTTWPMWKRIGYTTVNWVFTNTKGMAFGILFGSIFLTFLRYLPRKTFNSPHLNALGGLVIGAPLGVCVNCASPIGVGLYNGGARAETSLAAMIASPTFNIIVLVMLFSLFPFYMAATKIFLTLVVILIGVPFVCRFLPASKLRLADAEACVVNPPEGKTPSESVGGAGLGFLSDYSRDFWFIFRLTVPMMFLAGLLGSTLATLIPFEWFASLPVNFLTLLLASGIGVFAPAPIGFDIVLAAALLNAGVPTGLVMVMLFTLGIFSIVSFLVIIQSIPAKTIAMLTGVIMAVGIAGGYGAEAYKSWQTERALRMLRGMLDIGFVSTAHAQPAPLEPFDQHGRNASISVSQVPFTQPSKPMNDAETLFTRIEARHMGIDRPNTFSMADMFTPYNSTSGSISAADIDNDGDQDVIMGLVSGGIKIFLNDGRGRFTPQKLDLPILEKKYVFNAVPVDLNNNGWLDLFVTTHHGGNYILWNQGASSSFLWSTAGTFTEKAMSTVKNTEDAIVAYVVAFGDVNRNGYLDVVLGNHMSSRQGWTADERDRNRILFNEGGVITGDKFGDTPGPPGDTLSVLLSDFNQDGILDLVEANDFNPPDIFSLGDGKGGFRQLLRSDGVIPNSTHTTMSAKTADLNNDGRFEMYLTQIAGRDDAVKKLRVEPISDYCKRIERDDDREACQKNIDIRSWYKLGAFTLDLAHAGRCQRMTGEDVEECKAMMLRDIAIQINDRSLCKSIAPEQTRVRLHCDTMFTIFREPKGVALFPNEVPQVKGRNVLLARAPDGKFIDITKKAGLEIGGWSWDVKVFDFDNDELSDVYILNGFWGLQNVMPSNIYFRNTGSLTFKEETEQAGLVDFLIIPSAAAADFDGDGDVDMVAASLNGPVVAYINNSQTGNRIAFELRDHIGNRHGIGSRISIKYGENDERRQLRELQLSGGFTAFDSPVLYYGLGEYESVASIEVEWSTGEKTAIDGPFKAGSKYTISRSPATVN